MRHQTQHIFKVSFDTSKTAEHIIDAELLGNAIVRTATALKHADKVLNGEDSSLELEVKANSEGSFVVEFVTWLNSTGINVLSVLGISAGIVATKTIFDLLNEIRSRPVKAIVDVDKNTSKLILGDGTAIEADPKVARLVIDRAFRKDIEKAFKEPLDGAENAKLVIKDKNDVAVATFVEEQFKNFKAPARNVVEEVKDETKSVELYFEKVNFTGQSGWFVNLVNGESFSIKMKDENFLARINENKRISKGDLFVVQLRVITTFKSGKPPKYDREVIKVVRHRAAKDAKLIEDNE